MKKDLISIQNLSGNLVVSSRQVSESFEKQHKHIIEGIKVIETSVENSAHLFIESTYKDSYDRNQKEYLLTRDGFSLLVMGFTGQKALEWKLKYIEAFNKMEESIKNNHLLTDNLSPQLQLLINMELKQREFEIAITQTKSEIQGMRDVIKLDTNSWRTDSKDLIVKISHRLGGNEFIRGIRNESYELLNTRMGVSLETRLTNKRRRMADEGVSKSKRDKLNLLDVIADDKKLIEGYIAIVKEMAIKYGA